MCHNLSPADLENLDNSRYAEILNGYMNKLNNDQRALIHGLVMAMKEDDYNKAQAEAQRIAEEQAKRKRDGS
jgi:hypothetical protein